MNRKYLTRFIGFCFLVTVLLTGCGKNLFPSIEKGKDVIKSTAVTPYEDQLQELNTIATFYQKIYQDALKANTIGSDAVRDSIISAIGEKGYAVVDSHNKVNMVNASKVELFCNAVEDKEQGKLVLIRVTDNDGLVCCHLTTENGQVKVIRSVLKWNAAGKAEATFVEEYTACYWNYTDNGYLIFEKELPPGYDGASGHDAVRVKPLDPELRKLNEKYIADIGYEGNNMFFIDWSQDEYGDLCFEDLYEYLYEMRGQVTLTAKAGETLTVTKPNMDMVMKQFFNVSDEMIQKSIPFNKDSQCYQWTKRIDFPSVEMPYPEVIAQETTDENQLILTIHAVWAYKNTDDAFTHKVTIQLGDGGSYKFISNEIVKSKSNQIPEYIPRE